MFGTWKVEVTRDVSTARLYARPKAAPVAKRVFMEMAVIPYTYEACGFSDIGLVRENNKDVWAIIESEWVLPNPQHT